MDLSFWLPASLAVLSGLALWVVWERDRQQIFVRDVALWYLSGSVLVFAYPLWRSPDVFLQWTGYFGVALGFAATHSFLLLAVRRFAIEGPTPARLGRKIFAWLSLVYLLLCLTPPAINLLGLCSVIIGAGSGLYLCVKLWRRGRIERSIGVLLILSTALVNVSLLYGGHDAAAIVAALQAFFRVTLAFAFMFAALNRSAMHGERMLQRFEQLSEHSLQGIVVQDTERYHYVNPAAVAMYGYDSAAQMMAAPAFERAGNDQEREATRKLVARAIAGSSRLTEVAVTRRHPDGREVRMRCAGWPVDWDGQKALQVLLSDDTERQRAESELRRAEQESRRIEQEHREALTLLNAELEGKVIARTRDLAQSNADLADANMRMEHALESLRATQAELVQREKLASLGRMVAGIAHELNTPIGTALTVGTTLRGQVRQLRQDMASGQLKRASLNDFLLASSEGAELLESVLHKAHALISNFRQVTQDHSKEPRSRFSIAALLTSARVALQPSFENSAISLDFDIGDDVQLDSYPGHITQLLTQLIDNARRHAFTHGENGEIRVVLDRAGEGARITVSDNGKGIAADIQGKIFDPFFTTQLGGSVGLGLNTVYTTVTTRLGGTVRLGQAYPRGASFELYLPPSAPHTTAPHA